MLLEAKLLNHIPGTPADLETPVSVYLKLRGQGKSFLLESIDGGERIARYSFIGISPRARYMLRNDHIQVLENGTERSLPFSDDPLTVLEAELNRFHFSPQPGLPRFIGGLVGYLGYEAVRYFEPTLKLTCLQPPCPKAFTCWPIPSWPSTMPAARCS